MRLKASVDVVKSRVSQTGARFGTELDPRFGSRDNSEKKSHLRSSFLWTKSEKQDVVRKKALRIYDALIVSHDSVVLA